MAKLDRLLHALVERDARELVLTESEKPAFRFGDELRPVSQKPLNRQQITELVTELAELVGVAGPESNRPVRFQYRLADGPIFLCEAGNGNGPFRARLRPSADEAEEMTATAEPTAAVAPEPVGAVRGAPPEIDLYLRKMVEQGASDLHVSADEKPMIRQHGDMVALPDSEPLSPEKTHELVEAIAPERNRQEFRETHDTDFAHEIDGVGRFRVNVFLDRKGTGAVFRIIPAEVPTAEMLGLPPATLGLCDLTKGLVLVTGPTGSGKSTTLAAMINHINDTRSDHIITIEDPIEFVHANRTCLINQREVHSHTEGFKKALRAALREDPDIVLVGEMRDLETIAIAIETAETGHLVFGTLHTSTACSTVDRIIDQFPADRQNQIRTMLSESLKGVISQNLLKKNGGGRIAAMEVLIVTAAISNLIREAKTFQIPSLMQTGKKQGMVLLNDALLQLVKKDLVDPQHAYRKAVDKTGFANQLKAAGIRLTLPNETGAAASG